MEGSEIADAVRETRLGSKKSFEEGEADPVPRRKMAELFVSVDDFETRAAVLEGGELVEIYIERTDEPSIVGNVYLGRVRDILPGMQAAFVDIGLERNAFLYVDEVVFPEEEADSPSPPIQHLLKAGQDLLVQVIKEPMAGKGARVTTQITLPGRYLVLLPQADFVGTSRRLPEEERQRLKELCEGIRPRNVGLVARTAAGEAGREDLVRDLKRLMKLWKTMNRRLAAAAPVELIYKEPELAIRIVRDMFSKEIMRLVVDHEKVFAKIHGYVKKVAPELSGRLILHKESLPLFDKYNVNQGIDAALRRKIWLRSGGYVAIDATEALTAIDVNTGKYVGKKSLEETIFRTNLEAASEIVRQLRLRDIGGIIVIDFIDMENPKNRDEVFRVFNEALLADRTKTHVTEISRLGLLEMTRKNVAQGLQEFLGRTCPTCSGTGEVFSEATSAIQSFRLIQKTARTREAEAFLFRLNPASARFLQQKKKLANGILKMEKPVYVLSDPECPADKPELIAEGTKKQVAAEARAASAV